MSILFLPSLDPEKYTVHDLNRYIPSILNPESKRNFYTNMANCPSWFPAGVPFASPYNKQGTKLPAKEIRKIFAAFLVNCPERYVLKSPEDPSTSTSLTPITTVSYLCKTESISPPQATPLPTTSATPINQRQHPPPLTNGNGNSLQTPSLMRNLEQHLQAMEDRALTAERKVQELAIENEQLREYIKRIAELAERAHAVNIDLT